MARFKSELDSIIAQIRSGNTDPELLASALEALTEAGFTRDYDIMEIQFRGWDGTVPVFAVLKNTFGAEPVISVPAGNLTVLVSIPSVSGINTNNTAFYMLEGNTFAETPLDVYHYLVSIASPTELIISPRLFNFESGSELQSFSYLGGYVENTLVIKKLK